jgi:hypothetical protein
MAEAEEARAKRRYDRFRGFLILAYFAMFVVVIAGLFFPGSTVAGLNIVAASVARGALLILIPLTYLVSLVIAEVLYRLRCPVWAVCFAGAFLAPAAIVILLGST